MSGQVLRGSDAENEADERAGVAGLSNGLSDCAVIEPCSDISRLSSVYVITDFTGKREEGNEN